MKWALLATLAAAGLPSLAEAQVVQDCQPDQYLDRTAANADRELTWDFSISTDPERCMQVQVGQTVLWNGDLSTHPLGSGGGDMPNPIIFHIDGAVTFTTVGTFGFQCLSHSPMKGAIKVVAAAPPTVPVRAGWLTFTLTVLLMATGMVLTRKRRTRRAA
jgi:hypothetical protein